MESQNTSQLFKVSQDDEESSQASSLDTLLEKPSVYWPERRRLGFLRTPDYLVPSRIIVLAHAALVVVFGGAWLLMLGFYGYEYPLGSGLIQSPASDAVHYVKQTIDTNLYMKSEFFGPPGPEMDVAWDSLLRNKYSAVSPTDLSPLTSIALNDVTDRALITLEVFNSLECLNYMRKFTFRAHYNISEDPENVDRFGHCIERVRQTISCYADISFNTYVWRERSLIPVPNFRIEHECRDWNSIQSWAEEHSLPPLGDKMLRHPELGTTSVEP